jgi:hypothetical protein
MKKQTRELYKAYIKAGWQDRTGSGHIKLVPPTGTEVPQGQRPYVILCSTPSDNNSYKFELRQARYWGIKP